jgi:hypothetical protein
MNAVVAAITSIQEHYGDAVAVLNEDSLPTEVIPNFDSYRSIEATSLLEANLKVTLPESVFVGPKGPFTISQVLKFLQSKTAK